MPVKEQVVLVHGLWMHGMVMAWMARRIARACNEFAVRMREDYPGRFGGFATLPMPCARAMSPRAAAINAGSPSSKAQAR